MEEKIGSVGYVMENMSFFRSEELVVMLNVVKKVMNWWLKKGFFEFIENFFYRWSKFREFGLLFERRMR